MMHTQVDLEATAMATTMGITAGRVVTQTPGQGKITQTPGQGKITLAPGQGKITLVKEKDFKTCPQASLLLFRLSYISDHWRPCN